MDFLREWSPLLVFLMNALLGWVIWSVRRGLVSKEEHHQLQREVDQNKGAINQNKGAIKRIGEEVRSLPAAQEWTDLKTQLARVRPLGYQAQIFHCKVPRTSEAIAMPMMR